MCSKRIDEGSAKEGEEDVGNGVDAVKEIEAYGKETVVVVGMTATATVTIGR